MKFHPLADLFPLMEGAEFDELAASIKANGLREEITLLDNSILDGRNRFLACEKVSVEPRFEQFTGDDPHVFVADKNLHRRHLNPSQLSFIGAKMATLKVGNPNLQHPIAEISAPSNRQVARMLGIDRRTIQHAKRVLDEGTKEEIRAVEQGEAAVSTIARQIRKRVPADKRVIKSTAQADALRVNAKIWSNLRESLTLLTSMPRASDVARIARSYDKRTNVVDERLFKSIQWLKEFQNEWSKRNEAVGQNGSDTDDHADAGTGN